MSAMRTRAQRPGLDEGARRRCSTSRARDSNPGLRQQHRQMAKDEGSSTRSISASCRPIRPLFCRVASVRSATVSGNPNIGSTMPRSELLPDNHHSQLAGHGKSRIHFQDAVADLLRARRSPSPGACVQRDGRGELDAPIVIGATIDAGSVASPNRETEAYLRTT